ncbi:MAG TPA: hypothetical protein VJZ49_01395 [Syntrophales bacterium]|nr:hypothetical protein [Syntrophales bacterium]
MYVNIFLAMRATAQDRNMAMLLGVNVNRGSGPPAGGEIYYPFT